MFLYAIMICCLTLFRRCRVQQIQNVRLQGIQPSYDVYDQKIKIWECTDTTSVLRVHTHYTLHMTLLTIFIFTSFLANSLSNFFLIILVLHKIHSIIIRFPYLHRTIPDFFEGCTNFHYHIYQVNHDK